LEEAKYYKRLEEGKVRCFLCPQECVIKEGKRGFCRARENKGGKLYSLIYGETSSSGMDPIEKKPLYHFYPGRQILSLGTVGCNFACPYCQNWNISQAEAPTRRISPEEAVNLARENDSVGIAYTYSEPLVWYEYVLDTSRLARRENLVNVLVTNGFINKEPLKELLPFIQAMNIDVKSFREDFYKDICKGELAPVLRTAEMAKKSGVHIEITNLIIPTLNDKEEETRKLVDWVASSLGVDTPLHFSRYFPQYKFDLPATPVSTLDRAREIGLERLRYVYLGNVSQPEAEATYCYNCQEPLIERRGYTILKNEIKEGKCKYCGAEIDIVEA
jgi:pyruvate formate lyase activating enzyme